MTDTAQDIRRIKLTDLPVAEQARIEMERRKRQRAHIPESQKCADDFVYFVLNYVQIYDATEKKWIPFDLWAEQQEIATDLPIEKLVITLKARQLGMTWLVLAYALWLILFYPAATVLLFSLRDTEAVYLLSDERLRGMYAKLPSWLMMRKWREDNEHEYEWVPRAVETSGGHLWKLTNGSNARAFPTSAGDSYTATLAIVDEADLVPDLSALLLRVKPTIDGGGQLFLVSKVNKALPMSEFKTIYRAAKAGINGWKCYFLPWWVRPSRTKEWYARQKADAESRIGGTDDLYENYPATDTEALAPKQLDKRLPYAFISKTYSEETPMDKHPLPMIQGLRVYIPPRKGKSYAIGADPAEGNPNSDDSSVQVVDQHTGAQCAVLSGKFDVDVIATYIEQLSAAYNRAPVLVERNNHGHAVLANLRNSKSKKKVPVLNGDDGKPGWQSNKRTKVMLYDDLAQTITSGDCMIFDPKTFEQLCSIEGATLLAPEGLFDDEADSFALAQKARELKPPAMMAPMVGAPRNTALGAAANALLERPIGSLPTRMPTPAVVSGIALPKKAASKVLRVAIIGAPGTGKTTLGKQLAKELGLPYFCTDDVMQMGWGNDSLEVSKWLDKRRWLIEGVALPRALRKWREHHPAEKAPVDRVIYLRKVHRDLAPGAIAMGKGIDTVLKELVDWLPEIEYRD